jgi:signal transduction histidine kinase
MRRISLSTKLFAAALPLLVAVGSLLALTVRSDLGELHRAKAGADLGAVWDPLSTALTSIEAELDDIDSGAEPADNTDRIARIAANRRATDQALNDLGTSLEGLGAAQAAVEHITTSRSRLSSARRANDMALLAPGSAQEADPIDEYDVALRELVSIGQLLPAESNDAELGRKLLAVVKLAEGRVASDAVTANMLEWQKNPVDTSSLATARVRLTELESVMNEFAAIAPEEWAKQYRETGFTMSLAGSRSELDRVFRAAGQNEVGTFDVVGFEAVAAKSLSLQSAISQSIVDQANVEVSNTLNAALLRTGIILGAVLLAGLIAWALTRSVTRRVKAVSRSANQVAAVQLPALVEALRDPRGRSALPDIEPVNARGSDELAELANAFNSMQSTLVDVAQEQVEVLRRGVSAIFITMARRNRSLIDRQLAMLDEYEASVDDPEVLGNYYQLDHLATRMRRNSESLLVLANAEPKRRRVKATEIDDVVRASIGEVEDYRRVEVEALESLQVRGNVVADVSHMLAELLDNATSFSPPESIVRVGGRRAGGSYMIRIVDSGVGIGSERLQQLNELLRDPPIVGLSVEPTLGISVVSLLANKHGIEVTLSAGSPGLTVDVLLPSALFGPIDDPMNGGSTSPATPVPTVEELEQIVAWNDDDAVDNRDFSTAPADESFEPVGEVGPYDGYVPRSEPVDHPIYHPVPQPAEQPVAAHDWSTIAFDRTEFETTSSVDHADAAGSQVLDDPTPMPEPVLASDAARIDPFEAADPPAPVTEHLPVAPTPAFTPPNLPPPTAVARISSEFDRQPAPPMLATSPSRQPVTPDNARPLPATRPAPPTNDPHLPVRSPGSGPEGPDRLADITNPAVVGSSAPSALQAALSAFDSGRNATSSGGPALPTRARVGDPVLPSSFQEQVSVAQSRLDPDALRDRLRAFQTEFRTGVVSSDDKSTTPSTDLGGDHR